MNPHAQVLALIAERDASDAFSRAVGWVVLVTHVEVPEAVNTLYGPFAEPAGALEWAADFQAGLNTEGEEGFRCQTFPLMPVT